MHTVITIDLKELDQDDLQEYARTTFSVEEVFPPEVTSELVEWARDNGWVEKSELDAVEEEVAELQQKIEELEKGE